MLWIIQLNKFKTFILEKDNVYITDSDKIERKLPTPIDSGQFEQQTYQISF